MRVLHPEDEGEIAKTDTHTQHLKAVDSLYTM